MGTPNKENFNSRFRFREARKSRQSPREVDGLVSCISCSSMTGCKSFLTREPAFCESPLRQRRAMIRRYGFNAASESVCDAFASGPLPPGFEMPDIPYQNAILLNSQRGDIIHADTNCPYVREEARAIATGKVGAGIRFLDMSKHVPGEEIWVQICEMPCCATQLPYQPAKIDDYRRKNKLKPDGTEPRIWVRNAIIPHEKKVAMTPQQAESVFDLSQFNSGEIQDIHRKISAASDYLNAHSNRLGSRPLSEASNPVYIVISSGHHLLQGPSRSPRGVPKPEFWVYNEELFDAKKAGGEGLFGQIGIESKMPPIRSLEQIPEGVFPCIDSLGILEMTGDKDVLSGSTSVYGILFPCEDKSLASKGVGHVLQVRAISYHGLHHLWGVYGKGFSKVATFDEA